MKKFTRLEGRVLSLPLENIDTDQIIPASFLKGTGKQGLEPTSSTPCVTFPAGGPTRPSS